MAGASSFPISQMHLSPETATKVLTFLKVHYLLYGISECPEANTKVCDTQTLYSDESLHCQVYYDNNKIK